MRGLAKDVTMPPTSIHDNFVVGWSVSCVERTVVLHIEYGDAKPNEATDVVFRGIEAYHIVGDNLQSILFDIEDVTMETILRDFALEFESGVKYGWPGNWNKSMFACREHLIGRKLKGWRISSSYGLEGFVIAENMELVPRACGNDERPSSR
jgi:hypothetical protein